MKALAESAADLAERGWAVFPLIPGRKEPAVRWQTEQEWSKDPDYVYDEWPDGYNIGIACGPSGLLVADCDVKHGKDGIADLRRAIREIPRTFTVSTPSGGRHYYFATSRTWTNSRGSLPDSIDIRGSGGLVVAPGSIIGRRSYEIELDCDPAPVPYRLREILLEKQRKYQRQGWAVNQPAMLQWKRVPPVILKKRIEAWCDSVATMGEGDRNNLLHWTACRMSEIVDAGRITYQDAESDLLAAAQACGLDDDEALKTIGSGLSAGGR